jgi:hypothetical protein
MLVAIPMIMLSYYITKWAYSSGFVVWIQGVIFESGKRLLDIAIEILQKAFV